MPSRPGSSMVRYSQSFMFSSLTCFARSHQYSASNLVAALETCTERHSSRLSVIAYASSPNAVETG